MAINKWIGTDQNSNWSTGANWSLGTVPGEDTGDNTEEVFLEDSDVDINLGLDASAATYYLKSLHIKRTFTGTIGVADTTGVIGAYLQVSTAIALIGEHFGSGNPGGSGRLKIDYGSAQEADINVLYTAASIDSPKPAYRMLADNVLTVVRDVKKGSVGIASETGETSSIASASISYLTNAKSDATLTTGAGLTMPILTCLGGTTYMKGAATTINAKGGILTISGVGAVATLNCTGATVYPVSTGTITTCAISVGTCDFTQSAEPRTVTTLTLDEPGTLRFDNSIMTFTNETAPAESGRVQYRATKA